MKIVGILVVGIVVISIVGGLAQGASSTEKLDSTEYIVHDIIKIDSNSEFNPLHGVVGGTGTVDDPYIISGWEIDVGSDEDAIYIGNTTSYFVVENCYLHNASGWGHGVYAFNVKNGIIRGNTIFETGVGVRIKESSQIEVSYNIVYNTGYQGIDIYNSNNLTIDGNSVNSANVGLMLSETKYSEIKNNMISESVHNGFIIYSDSSWNNVTNNSILDSGGDGIYLYWGANNNTISGNFIANNGVYGVELSDYQGTTCYNWIFGNIFYYNRGSGDYYDSSIFQGNDEASHNRWYSIAEGYGNYWRDWANNNNTNDQNNDGVVDWPYSIAGSAGSYDKYPEKYAVPGAPQNLSEEDGSGYVNLTWKDPLGDGGKDISSYKIYRNGTLIAMVGADTLYYNDTGVMGNTRYFYYVVAVNEEGDGLSSNVVWANPEQAIPEFSMVMVVTLVLAIAFAVLYKRK